MKLSEAECLKLKNNRLTIEGAISILTNLNHNLKIINISDNNLKDIGKNRALRMKKLSQTEKGKQMKIDK